MFWHHLQDGESQLSMESDPSDPSVKCAVGRILDFDPARYLSEIPKRFYDRYPREIQLYLSSVLQARDDAGLNWDTLDPERIGLFDGVARPTLGFWYERIRAEHGHTVRDSYKSRDLMVAIPGQAIGLAASLLQVRGPTYTFTSTCSSGAVAIGHAMREIRSGEVDVALATGHEASLVPPLFAMYRDAGLISGEQNDPHRAVSPYVDHSANAFGEGAVTLVLEERSHAEARGANILAVLSNYSYGNNGYHPTSLDVVAVRPAEVIDRLLRRADVERDEVSFVVGHGNGVRRSDVSEENYMRRLFGVRAAEVPLVSVKPIYGHGLGSSSALNAAAAVMMINKDFIVPTINIDPERVRRVTAHQPVSGIAAPCEAGVAMSYGMGGQNAALLFTKYRKAEEESEKKCA